MCELAHKILDNRPKNFRKFACEGNFDLKGGGAAKIGSYSQCTITGFNVVF